MTLRRPPLEITIYQDVLCSWCYLAEVRLEQVRRELGDAFRWRSRPYALRLKDAVPTRRELRQWIREVDTAKKEPDGLRLSPTLWTQAQPPRSSVPALQALEAARLQGPDLHQALARSMQRAALEQGIDVTRSDVLYELACHVGLNMNRFSAAFGTEQCRRLILQEHKLASERGVRGVPTVVIAGRWMICGLREVAEYRNYILDCVTKLSTPGVGNPEGLVH
jgi:predicted DsbA family dithiol-disulfide isomerase